MNKTLIAFLAFSGVLGAFTTLGCAPGDGHNPVPPAKMEEIRQQEAQERENFVPPGTGAQQGQ